jgi:hypothetical protein
MGEKRPVQPTTTALVGYKSGVVLPAGYEKRGALLDNTGTKSAKQGGQCLRTIQEKREKCLKKVVKFKCQDCGNEFWITNRCKLRTCPTCARLKSKETFKRIKEFIKNTNLKKGYTFKMITLTSIKVGGLRKTSQFILKQFVKLWHNRLECEGAGAYVVLEFGKKHLRPHLHILYYGKYIPVREISKEWKRLTGAGVVDVRIVRGEGGIKEISKYVYGMSQKFQNDDSMLNKIEMTLKGIKRTVKYGIFRGIKESKNKIVCEHCGSNNIRYIGTQELSEFIMQQIYCRKKILWNSS